MLDGSASVEQGGVLSITAGITFNQQGRLEVDGEINFAQSSVFSILPGASVVVNEGGKIKLVSGTSWTIAEGASLSGAGAVESNGAVSVYSDQFGAGNILYLQI